MYDVIEHTKALQRACAKLTKEIEENDITACLIIRQSTKGGFRYSLTGNHVNAYTWIGFMEEIKTELLGMTED
jgi:hypothetical protein